MIQAHQERHLLSCANTPQSRNLQVLTTKCSNMENAQCYEASSLLPVRRSVKKRKSMQHLPVRPQIIFSGNIIPVSDELVHASCMAVSLDVCQCNIGCNVSSIFLSVLHELGCLLCSATHFSNHQARIIASPNSATAKLL